MAYLQLRYSVTRDRAEELSAALEQLHALSVSWENGSEDEYFEVAEPGEPDWPRVDVVGLFDSAHTAQSLLGGVDNLVHGLPAPRITQLQDQDWERAWLERFKPRKYLGDLWVCPSWVAPPDPRAVNVVIDPGLAFGTGDHPTTALCLDWISGHDCSGKTVVDYGCGSGILAIACLLEGAARAVGVDVDPRARAASVANASRNGVCDRYRALAPGEQRLPAGDLVLANILPNVLIDLNETLVGCTRKGGALLLSGIPEDQADRVKAAYPARMDFEAAVRDGWCLLVGRRRRDSRPA